MNDPLLQLPDADLWELAKALRTDRLVPPYSTMGVQRVIGSPSAAEIANDLQALAERGFFPQQIATTLDLIAKARSQRAIPEDLIDLVTTGPEAPGISNRDTSVVVRELFAQARQSVLVAGYAVYQGQRVFQALADRMAELPDLRVRLVLDIQRGTGDGSPHGEVVRRFSERFRTTQWPASSPLPKVFYDPRSLALDTAKRACMHAKCIVIDGKTVFVSSANLTEAAQERNVEIGLLISSANLADRLERHFDSLIAAGLVVPW